MSNEVRDKLVRELEEDGESYFEQGRFNNIVDLTLMTITVFASLVATVLATADHVPRTMVAAVAALPAAAASLQRLTRVRERSSWYFKHAARVRSLATMLQYAKAPDVEEFAKERAAMEVEMEYEWSKISNFGAASSDATAVRSAKAKTETAHDGNELHATPR